MELESKTLIPNSFLELYDDNEKKINFDIIGDLKLSTLSWFFDGQILSYKDLRFSPPTTSELNTYSQYQINELSTASLSLAMSLALKRPLLFIKYFKDKPRIIQNLPYIYEQLLLIDSSNIFLLRALLARTQISPPSIIKYWRQYLLDLKNDTSSSPSVIKEKENLANEEIRLAEGSLKSKEAAAYAQDFIPQSFASVDMLYVPVKVENIEVLAFIDSGAQQTIMSYNFARSAKIDHLIDTTHSGTAHGVGSGRILGRIHAISVKFGTEYIPISVSVMQFLKEDLLIGLDTLKSYQIDIVLSKNHLSLTPLGSKEITLSFAPEYAIKAYKKKRDDEIRRDNLSIKRGNRLQNIIPSIPLDFPGDVTSQEESLALTSGTDDDDSTIDFSTILSSVKTILAHKKTIIPVLQRILEVQDVKNLTYQAEHNTKDTPDERLRNQYRTKAFCAPPAQTVIPANNDILNNGDLVPKFTEETISESVLKDFEILFQSCQSDPSAAKHIKDILKDNFTSRDEFMAKINQLYSNARNSPNPDVARLSKEGYSVLFAFAKMTAGFVDIKKKMERGVHPEKVQQLVELGFPAQVAQQVLFHCGNDMALAYEQLEAMREEGMFEQNNDMK